MRGEEGDLGLRDCYNWRGVEDFVFSWLDRFFCLIFFLELEWLFGKGYVMLFRKEFLEVCWFMYKFLKDEVLVLVLELFFCKNFGECLLLFWLWESLKLVELCWERGWKFDSMLESKLDCWKERWELEDDMSFGSRFNLLVEVLFLVDGCVFYVFYIIVL